MTESVGRLTYHSVSFLTVVHLQVEYDPERTLLGRKGETIVLDKHTLAGGDVFIKECEDCTIFLCGSMGK